MIAKEKSCGIMAGLRFRANSYTQSHHLTFSIHTQMKIFYITQATATGAREGGMEQGGVRERADQGHIRVSLFERFYLISRDARTPLIVTTN